jgi:alpha-beta hydrolase superfamily lysophospholipase
MFNNKKVIKQVLTVFITLTVTYFAIIAYMVASAEPSFDSQPAHEMTAKEIDDLGFEQRYQSQPAQFIMRDSSRLNAQHFINHSDLSVVVLHGILSSSYTNNRFAGLIREAANAEVYSLDLRGHGSSDGNPGDVSYIGQYVDDVADVVEQIKKSKPTGKIIIAGHSMGGGISLRYAMKEGVPDIDGYLLFAPQLGDNAPTNVFSEDAARQQDESFMAIDLSRLIGLALLNSLNITQWNDMPVFFFNLPAEMGVNKYSFRSTASMSPADYKEGLQSVDKPLLVIVGENDEAFNVNAYQTAIDTYSNGEYHLIKGQSHNGIRHDVIAMKQVEQWIKANQFVREVK